MLTYFIVLGWYLLTMFSCITNDLRRQMCPTAFVGSGWNQNSKTCLDFKLFLGKITNFDFPDFLLWVKLLQIQMCLNKSPSFWSLCYNLTNVHSRKMMNECLCQMLKKWVLDRRQRGWPQNQRFYTPWHALPALFCALLLMHILLLALLYYNEKVGNYICTYLKYLLRTKMTPHYFG